MRISLVLVLLSSTVALSCASAPSPALSSFLSAYISQQTISSSNFTNASVGASSYAIMHVAAYRYIVINETSGFSFVLGNSTAAAVLGPHLRGEYYPSQSTLAGLNRTMRAFQAQGAPPVTDCLTETGIARYTCSIANSCYSCQTVPACKSALDQTGGPTGTLGNGIINFSYEYGELNRSYNSYYSTLSSMNQGNAYASLQELSRLVSNVSTVAQSMPNNPIFPQPSYISPSQLATCSSYSVNNMPWYCKFLGFCEYTTFNSTALATLQSEISILETLPISNSSVSSIAANATLAARAYIQPQITRQFNELINATQGRYNATVANATELLGKLHNESLSNSLGNVEATFSMLKGYNPARNASQYNATLSSMLSNLSATYQRLSSSYSAVESLATNNTARILLRELNYRSVPPSLSALASEQQSINYQLSQGINASQEVGLLANMSSIKGRIGILAPLSFAGSVKGIDGGLINGILSGSNAPIQSKLSAAPLYALVLSLVIAAAAILLIYLGTFHRLQRRHRLKLHRKAKRAWMALFIALVAVGLAYSFLTYAFAQAANAFLPASGFFADMASHSTVFIALNGTYYNSSVVNCAASLQQTLTSRGKTVHTVDISNDSCVSSGTSAGGEPCYDQMLSSGDPVVVMSSGPNNIVYRGLYGYTLYASGASVSGSSCYLNQVFRVQ